MSIEMKLLLWSVGLALLQMLIAVSGATLEFGLMRLMGNREDLPTAAGWAGRARRAHLNMLENLPLFAILVLIAQATGKSNETTVLGAQLFFWARVAYVPIYIAGIPFLRTISWATSVAGMVFIFGQLF